MPKIFISYRREDSQHQADRLHAALKPHVGNPKRDIFIDVDNIPVGVDFGEHLDRQVAQCDVLLALIGPDWLDVRNPKTGKRRLDDPEDFVRIEIASALKRGIPVAPVLLDGAPIPSKDDLPDDLKALARRNGVEVRRSTFDTDADRMIRGLDLKAIGKTPRAAAVPRKPAPGGRGWIAPVIAMGLFGIAGGGAAIYMLDPFGWKGGATTAGAESNPAPSGPAPSVSPPSGGDPPPPASPREDSVGAAGGSPPPPKAGEVATPAKPVAPEGAARSAGAAPALANSSRSAGETFRDCSGCPEMVAIPAGSFMMGSPSSESGRNSDEGPQRRVTVPAFAAGKYEVTSAEYNACVSDGGCAAAQDDGFGGGARPVTNVSWNDAKKYVAWLNGKVDGSPYRLLSEAEWEYAARAGTTTAYSFGGSINSSQANFNGGPGKTTPVGQYPANAFGLHDMHGNVWEWVEDCHEGSYSAGQPSDGKAFTEGSCSNRVNRGGSWINYPRILRSATRGRGTPTFRIYLLGFRVARTN